MRLPRYVAMIAALSLGITIAKAEVVPVVAARSPVTTLSRKQVMDIFLGSPTRFPNGEQAVPIDQPEGSTVRDEFYATVAGKSAALMKAHWSKIIFTGRGQPPREAASSSETKKLLANNPNAIGYIDTSELDNSVKVLKILP